MKKKVDKIIFSLYSPDAIRKLSAVKVTQPDTYDDDGYPLDNGLMDLRMGVIDPGLACKTCGSKPKECPGHFGHIELVRPVIHPLFAKDIYYILSSTCPKCYDIIKKSTTKCPHCGADIKPIKFVKPTTFYMGNDILLPTDIREWFSHISDSVVEKLGYNPEYARPEWMILTVLPVPPTNIRPSIILHTGERSEDDLTHKLVDIIRTNQKLEAHIEAGTPQLIIEDMWELVQYHVTTYFNNESTNIPPSRHRSGRPLKTLTQRLKGKEGRFRYNLSGKRVNFSARTVITPDPNISMNEVGVPLAVAEQLSVPINVTEWNLEAMKNYIKRKEHPMALYVIRNDGKRIKVTDITREDIIKQIEPGWVVERQLKDGDIVLFNRQPSLHRISMMAHIVRVLPGRTFRINPLVNPPYNSDFDGDEMNLHVVQSEEARAEALELMLVEKNILSPRNGHAIIKPQEDYITGVYYLVKNKFNKTEATNIAAAGGIYELPKPNKEGMYDGKEIFSLLLPKNLNVRTKTSFGEDVLIKNGQLLHGGIDSKVMDKDLIENIFLNYGSDVCRKFIDSVVRMGIEALTLKGITVSLKNYTLSKEAEKKIDDIIEKMNKKIDHIIMEYQQKTLERLPGTTLKETFESLIMSTTSKARGEVEEVVKEDLGSDNSSVVMALIGARGSMLNAVQMSSLVAQQAIRNKRPNRGYKGRNLVFFKKNKEGAREKGFVRSSFRKGLSPEEFFYHAMGGRESIVNIAIRTGRSGYMQRRLINALSDLVVEQDLSVRDASNNLVQTIYGGDGKDPMYSSSSRFEVSVKMDDVDTAV